MTKENRDLIQELHALREENQSLKIDNDFLQRQNHALKLRCGKYAIEIRELNDELADLRFAQKLYGNPTDSELAEEAIVKGEQAYYERGIALYGDDF